MKIHVRYWSWFRDLARTQDEDYHLPESAVLGDLLEQIHDKHAALAEVRKSTLVAVGLEYQPLHWPLKNGDEVSLFPPVQGG